jgi:hypothetical protein
VIKVLDHLGQPHPQTQFRIRVNNQEQTLSSDANSILDLSFTAGAAIELHWLGKPNAGETTSLPVIACYETGNSANPDALLQIDAAFTWGHLQLFELANWFSAPNDGSDMLRYHTSNRVEPLSDGFRTFKLIAADMINCVPSAGNPAGTNEKTGAHFAGWGFKEFVLDDKLLDENGKPFTYSDLYTSY